MVKSATYFATYNQPAAVMAFIASVGVMTSNATLLDTASKYFKAFLTVGTFDGGLVAELIRWADCPGGCSGSAWGHAGGVMASLFNTADVIGRAGDMSLYTFSTPIQTINGSGGTISLLSIADAWAQMANKTLLLYATDTGPLNSQTLLSWDTVAPGGDGGPHYFDFAVAIPNLYYQDADLTTCTQRLLAGGNTSSSCADAQFAGCFSSVWVNWPDLPFMWGNMAGVVDPYTLSGATPTVTITAPTSAPTYATAVASLTTMAGTAFDPDGVSSVTWSCNLCGSGAATGTTTWTIPAITLQLGVNVITVTAHDPGGAMTTDQLTVTYALPDITTGLVLHLKLNENGGTTATDAAGGDNPGTISGGATWVTPGIRGAAALGLDGVNDFISIAGVFGSPANVTLAAWINMDGFPFGESEVISMGDAVALRVGPTGILGFFHDASTWNNLGGSATLGTTNPHHLAYTVTSGAQALYLDGVPIATAASTAPIVYTGMGSSTVVGTHGQGSPGWFLQAVVDEVRVYNRALSSVDIAGLYAFTDAGPAVTITQPASSATYTSDTATLTTVAGTASDDVAVTAVTWACPTCTPTSGTATGLTAWSIPTVTLAVGANVLTVTATDAETQTAVDSLTVAYTAPPAPGSVRVIPGITLGGAAR